MPEQRKISLEVSLSFGHSGKLHFLLDGIEDFLYGDKNNPIITKVEKLVGENGDSEICEITFFW